LLALLLRQRADWGPTITNKLREDRQLKETGARLQNSPFGLADVAASTDKGDTENDRTPTEARAMVARERECVRLPGRHSGGKTQPVKR